MYVYHHKSWQVFLPAKDRDITVASSNAHDTKMPCSSLGCNAGPFQTISIRHSKVLFPQGISKGIPSGNQRINGKSPKTRRFVARKIIEEKIWNFPAGVDYQINPDYIVRMNLQNATKRHSWLVIISPWTYGPRNSAARMDL